MDVEIVEKTPFSITLRLRGVSLHLVNAIRRVIMAEVPTMGVDYVVFTQNSSVFYDEYIAHRLAMIPLTSDHALEKYLPPEECAEAGEKGVFSEDCFVKLELEAEALGPEPVVVYSGQLRSSDPDVKPVFDNIPVVKLVGDQKIRLEAYARLGRGKEHIKWSPVSIAAHKYVPKISIDYSKCNPSSCGKCLEICPRNVFRLVDGKVVLSDRYELTCTLCQLCEHACPSSAIKVSWAEDEFFLKLETTGSLSVRNILLKSLDILTKKLDDFIQGLSGVGGGSVTVQ